MARFDGSVHHVVAVGVSAGEGEALRGWVIREGAARTISVDLGYGVSTLFICGGLLATASPDALHVTIDLNQKTRLANLGPQLLEEGGVAGLVDHYAEESQIVLPRLVAKGCRFALGFVDGNHRLERVSVDLIYLGRLLRPGRSASSTTTSCGPSIVPPRSSCATWAGRWRSSQPPRTATTGRSSAPTPSPTRGRSMTSWSSEAEPGRPCQEPGAITASSPRTGPRPINAAGRSPGPESVAVVGCR